MNKNENIEYSNKISLTEEDFNNMKNKNSTGKIKSMNLFLFNDNNLSKYSWEVDGERIMREDCFSISREDKKILKFLMLKKVPENKRARLWLLISGAKREIHNNKKYYKSLTEYFPSTNPSAYENQIELDLKRTYPEEKFFQSVEILRKMKNILLAYSRRNISIGYCQGFNFIVGRLLKIFDKEEEAFWVFVQIIENILPLNYYCEMIGTIIDQSILQELIKEKMPDLNSFFVSNGFDLAPVSLQWFISLFSQNLSYEICIIIWDVLLLEGSVTLFKTALTILKILKKDIMSKSGIEEIYTLMDYAIKNISDTNVLVYSILLKKNEFDIDNNYLIKSRYSLEPEMVERIKNSRQTTQKILSQKFKVGKQHRVSFVQENIACNKEWQICIYDIEYKFNFASFLILRIYDFDKVEIFEDYFIDKLSTKLKSGTYKNKHHYSCSTFIDYHNLLIERKSHRCEIEDKKSEKNYLDEKSILSKSIDLRDKFIIEDEEFEDEEKYEIAKKDIFENNNMCENLELDEIYKIKVNKLRSFTTINPKEVEDKDQTMYLSSINSKFKEIVISRMKIKEYLRESSFNYSNEINLDDI